MRTPYQPPQPTYTPFPTQPVTATHVPGLLLTSLAGGAGGGLPTWTPSPIPTGHLTPTVITVEVTRVIEKPVPVPGPVRNVPIEVTRIVEVPVPVTVVVTATPMPTATQTQTLTPSPTATPGDGEPKPPAVVYLPVVCHAYGEDGAGARVTPGPTVTVV